MRLSTDLTHIKHSSLVFLLTLGLSACGGSSISSADIMDAYNNVPVSEPYEVVTITRPEDLSRYVNFYKVTYTGCANLARDEGLPVKPFVAIPEDFVIEKDTYIRDGENELHTTETNAIRTALDPENGCSSWIGQATTLRAVKDGSLHWIKVHEDGERVVQPVDVAYKTSIPKKERYTESKVVNGIRLKCPQESNWTSILGMVCVLEDIGATEFIRYEGSYLTAYARDISVEQQIGAVITEPVSVKTKIKVDPEIFNIK